MYLAAQLALLLCDRRRQALFVVVKGVSHNLAALRFELLDSRLKVVPHGVDHVVIVGEDFDHLFNVLLLDSWFGCSAFHLGRRLFLLVFFVLGGLIAESVCGLAKNLLLKL